MSPAPWRPAAGPVLLGITGGLATGKSTVACLLAGHGATVFSADAAARAILIPGGAVLRALRESFGPAAFGSDGSLDRVRLGRQVFQDPEARARLNEITHPQILRLLRAQAEAASADLTAHSIVAFEVPLLYEAGVERWFDLVVVVNASEATQVRRLQARNGLDCAEALRRIAAQAPLAEKLRRADHVIVNDGERAEVEAAVTGLWNRLRAAHPSDSGSSRSLSGS